MYITSYCLNFSFNFVSMFANDVCCISAAVIYKKKSNTIISTPTGGTLLTRLVISYKKHVQQTLRTRPTDLNK